MHPPEGPMDIRTHHAIDQRLCGVPTSLSEGHAEVRLDTVPAMAADEQGLVHGGFVFGAADHAAMLAINDPHVVLGSAAMRFVAPVRVGEQVVVTARRTAVDRRRHTVEVSCAVDGRSVLTGTLECFVLDRHVLAAP